MQVASFTHVETSNGYMTFDDMFKDRKVYPVPLFTSFKGAGENSVFTKSTSLKKTSKPASNLVLLTLDNEDGDDSYPIEIVLSPTATVAVKRGDDNVASFDTSKVSCLYDGDQVYIMVDKEIGLQTGKVVSVEPLSVAKPKSFQIQKYVKNKREFEVYTMQNKDPVICNGVLIF